MRTHVTVERNTLKFAAAHMATFEGEVEPLHGHNYAVIVHCEGLLTDDGWVVDFGMIKRIMRRLCEALDHKFLLQRPSELLAAVATDEHWEITAGGARRYVLPTSDVLPLPITNSTAEQIAGWLHGRLCDELRDAGVVSLAMVEIGVEEAPGQTGWYASAFPGGPPRATVKEEHTPSARGRHAHGDGDAD